MAMRDIEQHQNADSGHQHGHNGNVKVLRQYIYHRKRCKRRNALQHERLTDIVHTAVDLIFAMQNVDNQSNRFEAIEERDCNQSI